MILIKTSPDSFPINIKGPEKRKLGKKSEGRGEPERKRKVKDDKKKNKFAVSAHGPT